MLSQCISKTINLYVYLSLGMLLFSLTSGTSDSMQIMTYQEDDR